MDRLQLTGQNPDQVFNFRSDQVHAVHLPFYGVKRPNLKLKTRPKECLGCPPLDITLTNVLHGGMCKHYLKNNFDWVTVTSNSK